MKSKEELKKLFENGDKPTQEEFWEWQDSYWHKDEKLPTENAGLYKIKGSVPDLTALHLMNSMSEGDVYNLLDTGDNYVYVLDLNNTGEAGWDKLGGRFSGSFVPLTGTEAGEKVTGNIEVASSVKLYKLKDVPNEEFIESSIMLASGGVILEADTSDQNGKFYVTPYTANFEFLDSNNQAAQIVVSGNGGLSSPKDFTNTGDPLSFAQKKYVDDTISASTPTLQTVLDNGNTATNPDNLNTIRLNTSTGQADFQFQDSNKNQSNMLSHSLGSTLIYNSDVALGAISVGFSPNEFIVGSENSSGNYCGIKLTAEEALTYNSDYSSKFIQRSLVDKGWVENAIATSVQTANLQTVLDNNYIAQNSKATYKMALEDQDGNSQVSFHQQSPDGNLMAGFNLNVTPVNNLAVFQAYTQHTDKYFAISLRENALEYHGDYSADYTDRSLVDKAYVDSKISSPLELSWSPWTNCIVESYQETTFNQLRWRRKGDTIQIDGVAIRQNNNTIGNAFAFMPSQLKPSFDMKFTGWNGRTNSFLMIYFSSDNSGLSINGTASLTDPLSFTIEYTI